MDIRLVEMFLIKDPSNPDRKFATSDSPVADRLPVTLKEGDEFVVPVTDGQPVRKFDIRWRLDSDCTYEIHVNAGGGQFNKEIEAHSEGGLQGLRMNTSYIASDVMIRVTKGQGTITYFGFRQ